MIGTDPSVRRRTIVNSRRSSEGSKFFVAKYPQYFLPVAIISRTLNRDFGIPSSPAWRTMSAICRATSFSSSLSVPKIDVNSSWRHVSQSTNPFAIRPLQHRSKPSITDGCGFNGSKGASVYELTGDSGPFTAGTSNLTKIAVSIWSSSKEDE